MHEIGNVLNKYSEAAELEKEKLKYEIKPKLAALIKELAEVVPKDFDWTIKSEYSFKENKIVAAGHLEVNPYGLVNTEINDIYSAADLLLRIQEIEAHLRIKLEGKYFEDAKQALI